MFLFRKKPELHLTDNWLESLRKDISETQLKYKEPWKQAGFDLGQDDWETCRKPIAECIIKDGNFLDIGCANGYLLESIMKWTTFKIVPWGVDLSPRVIAAAKARLKEFSDNFFTGSVTKWSSPIKFEYVRTELDYAVVESQEQYLRQVLNSYVSENGALLLTEYRSKKDANKPWLNDKVNGWDFRIVDQKSAFLGSVEMTRVSVITHKTGVL